MHLRPPHMGSTIDQSLYQLTRGPRYRRTWNDHAYWARCLAALPKLEVLRLKTSAPLVLHPGDYFEEQQLVEKWVSTREPNTSKIHSIVLWYLADTSYASHDDFTDSGRYPIVKGVFSRWSKILSQPWQRMEIIIGAL